MPRPVPNHAIRRAILNLLRDAYADHRPDPVAYVATLFSSQDRAIVEDVHEKHFKTTGAV